MIDKVLISILFFNSMLAMHNMRLNGNFVSDEDMDTMEPFKYDNGRYNVTEKEQLAVHFALITGKHAWLYAQMVDLPKEKSHVGFATRSVLGPEVESHKNFAIDFQRMIIRKLQDKIAGK